MKRYLVTGGSGFIGTHLTSRLKKDPTNEVLSVGSKYDLRDDGQAQKLFSENGKFHYIFHLADVQGNMAWTAQNCGSQFLDNTKITGNVLAAWRHHQPEAKFVGFSSLWAYPSALSTASEEDYWSGRMDPAIEHYGLNKKILGVGIESFKKQWGMHGTMLVLGSAYGPLDKTHHVIPSLIRRMEENPDCLQIWGDGSQARDFIFVEDQVEGILRHSDYAGDLLNIGSGRSYTVKSVVEILVDLMRYKGEVRYDLSKPTGGQMRVMNLKRAQHFSGWPDNHAFRSLKEGLTMTLNPKHIQVDS